MWVKLHPLLTMFSPSKVDRIDNSPWKWSLLTKNDPIKTIKSEDDQPKSISSGQHYWGTHLDEVTSTLNYVYCIKSGSDWSFSLKWPFLIINGPKKTIKSEADHPKSLWSTQHYWVTHLGEGTSTSKYFYCIKSGSDWLFPSRMVIFTIYCPKKTMKSEADQPKSISFNQHY